MSLRSTFTLRKAGVMALFVALASFAAACGVVPIEDFASYNGRPAKDYDFASTQPLRVAVIDEAGGNDWALAIDAARSAFGASTPNIVFQSQPEGANIVMRVRGYNDAQPPEIPGYSFIAGVGGFAAVYDADGVACNFPPSTLPMDCSGEIATANIYVNDATPAGDDIEIRRGRLILHEVGHALGLERHAPTVDTAQLNARYGWQ